ncbi:DinB family protein [Paenibacillus sp. M1]|uniref:DinB family protein n=1 Tax=Paenibacillus haidiansis TaxID=1574488 RepID=A0ABU7VN05_9BACL
MLKRPEIGEIASHFQAYIQEVPDEDLEALLEKQVDEVIGLMGNLTEEQAAYRYAEGKWSLKQVLGHITDTERIFSYRLLCIARGDKTPLPGFEEGLYAVNSPADRMTLNELLQDFAAVRISTLSLFRQLQDEEWERVGTFSGNPGSAKVLAYLIAGHSIHHLRIIRERYLQN